MELTQAFSIFLLHISFCQKNKVAKLKVIYTTLHPIIHVSVLDHSHITLREPFIILFMYKPMVDMGSCDTQ